MAGNELLNGGKVHRSNLNLHPSFASIDPRPHSFIIHPAHRRPRPPSTTTTDPQLKHIPCLYPLPPSLHRFIASSRGNCNMKDDIGDKIHRAAPVLHCGEPSPDFQDWDITLVCFHGYADMPTITDDNDEGVFSPSFYCFGREWQLNLAKREEHVEVGLFLRSSGLIEVDCCISQPLLQTQQTSLSRQLSL